MFKNETFVRHLGFPDIAQVSHSSSSKMKSPDVHFIPMIMATKTLQWTFGVIVGQNHGTPTDLQISQRTFFSLSR